MNIFQILILSAVEGLTEFLPISSTAHLIITAKILKISQSNFQKLFEVFIQAGAILAVIFLYWGKFLKNKNLIRKIIISFLPTGLFGFIFYKLIKDVFFEHNLLLSFSLFFLGATFLIIELLIFKKKLVLQKSLKDLTFKEAFFIGFFQSLAIVPGISRAGAVMVIMLILGYKRKQAAVYSFLLAVPTILAAAFFDLYKNKQLIFLNSDNFFYLSFGSFLSFIFALISVKFLISFLEKNTLVIFGIYRIILGIINFIL